MIEEIVKAFLDFNNLYLEMKVSKEKLQFLANLLIKLPNARNNDQAVVWQLFLLTKGADSLKKGFIL